MTMDKSKVTTMNEDVLQKIVIFQADMLLKGTQLINLYITGVPEKMFLVDIVC